MQSFKKIVSDFTMKRLFWLVLGTAILSFGIHNIHQRAAITEGGVIGLVLLFLFLSPISEFLLGTEADMLEAMSQMLTIIAAPG